MNPRILLLCHDLGTRLQLTATWTAAGATVLAPASTEVPDYIVVDLGRRDALSEIARLRSLHPGVGIVSCGASFDEATVTAAKAAGADDFAARSFVDRRVSRRLKLPG
jgi:DNA-binding NarL/FixJ family response regulator